MKFIQFLKDRYRKDEDVPATDGTHNPYEEKLLQTIDVTVNGEVQSLDIREIKNKKAEVMGAHSIIVISGEKIPLFISSPRFDTFSMGVTIALPRELLSEFKVELKRLKDEGLVSEGTKISYNPDTKNAILFCRSDSKVNGNLPRWRDICAAKMQTFVNDVAACMPYVMNIYGE